jgi:hypothetical protein
MERPLPEHDRAPGGDGVEVGSPDLLVELGVEPEHDEGLTGRLGGFELTEPGEKRVSPMRRRHLPAGEVPGLGGHPLTGQEQGDEPGVHVRVDQARQEHVVGETVVDDVLEGLERADLDDAPVPHRHGRRFG